MKVGDILNRYNYIIREFSREDRSDKNRLSETAFLRDLEDSLEIGEPEKSEKEGSVVDLSPEEKLALHFLFGVSEPEELSFYNRGVRFDQIAKGNLLDVKG